MILVDDEVVTEEEDREAEDEDDDDDEDEFPDEFFHTNTKKTNAKVFSCFISTRP